MSLVIALPLIWACHSRSRTPAPEASVDTLARQDVACSVSLTAHQGTKAIDERIRKAQDAARKSQDPRAALERLGWLYVSKARLSFDDGYYSLAQRSARCLQAVQGAQDAQGGESAGALLLLGHVSHQLHQFQKAEEIGRRLVEMRGAPFDHGLLGDALMEQGRVKEAAQAYQVMIDLKPDLRGYVRAAHVRWLKGDLPGALKLMETAVRAGGQRDSEATAWALTRLSAHQLQAGLSDLASAAAEAALRLHPDYAPALLAKGRVLLSLGKAEDAAEYLKKAAFLKPLPEYQWTLAEALRAQNNLEAAHQVEQRLADTGAQEDPRTFSLYLATRGRDPEQALRLAREELRLRQDVFTYDALAWSLHAASRTQEALEASEKALAEGTLDARLFLHAGVIASESGDRERALDLLGQAKKYQHTLLPSERRFLKETLSGGQTTE